MKPAHRAGSPCVLHIIHKTGFRA